MAKLSPLRSLPPIVHRTLQQPGYWATVASVGVHGLLLVVLPMLPSQSSSAEDSTRAVDIVELTPDQLNRLPDLASSDVALPDVPIDPNDFNALLNDPSWLTSPPSLDNTQSYSNFNNFNNFDSFDLDATVPTSPLYIPSPPPLDYSDLFTVEEPAPEPEPQAEPEPEPQAESEPEPEPEASEPPPNEDNTVENADFGEPRPMQDLAEMTPENTPSEADPNETAQDAVPPNQVAVVPPASAEDPLVASNQELRELLTFNPVLTEEGEVRGEFNAWKDRVETEYPVLQSQEQSWQGLEIDGDYPRMACVLGEEAQTVVTYGVIVDAEGRVLEDPTLIQSSGYGVFNEAAKSYLSDRQFDNNTGDVMLYMINVNFSYDPDLCPAMLPQEEQPTG